LLQNLDRDSLAVRARELGIEPQDGDSFDDIFFRIFISKIELNLGVPVPTVLYDYPVSMASLARKKPSDPRVAERVEIYIGGLELANGFGELTDPEEQRERFIKEGEERRCLGKTVFPIDEELLFELKHIGTAAGIALGVDRLAMVLTGAGSIEEVIAFGAGELFKIE
ncbi:MAG: amino acid--tRNA ligase-related protein, partial [bacterium]